MNVIARLEYELAYYDSAVHRFHHYTTRTPTGWYAKKQPPSVFDLLSLSLWLPVSVRSDHLCFVVHSINICSVLSPSLYLYLVPFSQPICVTPCVCSLRSSLFCGPFYQYLFCSQPISIPVSSPFFSAYLCDSLCLFAQIISVLWSILSISVLFSAHLYTCI